MYIYAAVTIVIILSLIVLILTIKLNGKFEFFKLQTNGLIAKLDKYNSL